MHLPELHLLERPRRVHTAVSMLDDASLPPVGIKTRQSLPAGHMTNQFARAASCHSVSVTTNCLLDAHGSQRDHLRRRPRQPPSDCHGSAHSLHEGDHGISTDRYHKPFFAQAPIRTAILESNQAFEGRKASEMQALSMSPWPHHGHVMRSVPCLGTLKGATPQTSRYEDSSGRCDVLFAG